MRTSMSAMGSVMLMGIPYECTDIRFRENLFWLCPGAVRGDRTGPAWRASRQLYTSRAPRGATGPAPVPGRLPAGLAQARHVAAHGGLAQHVAAEAELRVDRARTPGQGAAGGLAGGRRVARQLLQPGRGFDL